MYFRGGRVLIRESRSPWAGGEKVSVPVRDLRRATQDLVEETVNVVVRDLGKERVVGLAALLCDSLKLGEEGREVARRLLDAQLYETEARTVVENDDEQHA